MMFTKVDSLYTTEHVAAGLCSPCTLLFGSLLVCWRARCGENLRNARLGTKGSAPKYPRCCFIHAHVVVTTIPLGV